VNAVSSLTTLRRADRAAMATAETPEQVVEILRYATVKG
jgi:hypothetical protein